MSAPFGADHALDLFQGMPGDILLTIFRNLWLIFEGRGRGAGEVGVKWSGTGRQLLPVFLPLAALPPGEGFSFMGRNYAFAALLTRQT